MESNFTQKHNPLLEAREERLHEGLDALADIIDEDFNLILQALSGDETFVPELKPIAQAAKKTCDNFLLLVALQHPVATDLKYALAALRVEHDYERVYELSVSLNERINRLKTLFVPEILRHMTEVMSDLIKLNQTARHAWKRGPDNTGLPSQQAQLTRLSVSIQAGIQAVQEDVLKKLEEGAANPESFVDLV